MSINIASVLNLTALSSSDYGHTFCPATVLADGITWRQCQRTRARMDRIVGRAALLKLQSKMDAFGREFCEEDRFAGLLEEICENIVCRGCGHEDQVDSIVVRWMKKIERAWDEVERVAEAEREKTQESSEKDKLLEDMMSRLHSLELMQDKLQTESRESRDRYSELAAENEAFRAWKDSPIRPTPSRDATPKSEYASAYSESRGTTPQRERPFNFSPKIKTEGDEQDQGSGPAADPPTNLFGRPRTPITPIFGQTTFFAPFPETEGIKQKEQPGVKQEPNEAPRSNFFDGTRKFAMPKTRRRDNPFTKYESTS